MRAHFFWPDCTLNMLDMQWTAGSRSVFWVSATPDEVESKIAQAWPPEFEDPFLKLSPTQIEDSYILEGRHFFFVPANDIKKLQQQDPPILGMWVYPYSGMWNGRRPWIPIGPPKGQVGKDEGRMVFAEEPVGVEVRELTDLYQLRFDLINKHHLAPSVA